MSKRVLQAFVVALGLFVGAAFAGDATWLTSMDEALKVAKKEKKVVLVDFTGSDWCGWCIKLKKEVFDTPKFKEWAEKKAVLLELDFPRKKAQDPETKAANKKLLAKYKVEGFPTILVLDAEGKEIARLGYEEGGPEAWIKKAEAEIAAGSKKDEKDEKGEK